MLFLELAVQSLREILRVRRLNFLLSQDTESMISMVFYSLGPAKQRQGCQQAAHKVRVVGVGTTKKWRGCSYIKRKLAFACSYVAVM